MNVFFFAEVLRATEHDTPNGKTINVIISFCGRYCLGLHLQRLEENRGKRIFMQLWCKPVCITIGWIPTKLSSSRMELSCLPFPTAALIATKCCSWGTEDPEEWHEGVWGISGNGQFNLNPTQWLHKFLLKLSSWIHIYHSETKVPRDTWHVFRPLIDQPLTDKVCI